MSKQPDDIVGFSLADCGREVHLREYDSDGHSFDAKIIMVIKSPKGIMALFGYKSGISSYYGYSTSAMYQDAQAEAIRAFVGQYKV